MKKYIINQSTCQALSPICREIYLKMLQNANKSKKRQEFLTLSNLTNKIYYALGSVANALQLLRNLGLVFFNKKTNSWMLVLNNHDSIDIYDLHVNFKRDWSNFVSMAKENPISKFLRLEDRLVLADQYRRSDNNMGNRMNYNERKNEDKLSKFEERVSYRYKPERSNLSIEEQLKKERRKNQTNRTSIHYSK